MAFGEVTGATVQELAELQSEYERSPHHEKTGEPFESTFCLTRIGKQPEDYDGPTRWCRNRASVVDGERGHSCRFHGGMRNPDMDNLDPQANLKHSMYALPETIYATLTEEERELYEWVFTWPEVYEIDLSADPAAEHDFETLALEIVRQARSSDYILANTEVRQEGVYTAQGELLETKEVPNSLIDAHQRQIRLINTIKDALGITRKAQAANDTQESANDLMDSLSTVLSGFTSGGEYDPDQFE